MPRLHSRCAPGFVAIASLVSLAAAQRGASPFAGTPPTGNAPRTAIPQPMRVPPLFLSAKPEATVVIQRHPTGADLVEVTVVDAKYPPDSLRRACERVGEIAGTPVRGLVVTNTNPATNEGFPKATFATNGLIADAAPRLRLEPVLRAFGYAPTPLKTLALIYLGERAGEGTLQTWSIPDGPYRGQIRLAAQRLPPGPKGIGGIEYRTLLGTLPESAVVLPGARTAEKAPLAKPVPPSGVDPVLIGVGILGVIAAGALVYAVAARPRSGTVIAEKPNRKG